MDAVSSEKVVNDAFKADFAAMEANYEDVGTPGRRWIKNFFQHVLLLFSFVVNFFYGDISDLT